MLSLLIPCIIFTVTSAILTIIVPIFGRKPIHVIWTLLNFCVAWWGACLIAVALVGNDIKLADLCWRFANIGGLFIAAFFVHFVHIICELKKKFMLIASYLHLIFFSYFTINGHLEYNLRFIYNAFYYPSATQPLYATEAIIWIYFILYGHYILFLSRSRFSPDKNIQIRFLLFAFIIGFLSGGAPHWLRVFGINVHPGLGGFITIYTLMVTYAIFRHKLLGLDLAIRKGLVYTLLLSIFTGLYFVMIFMIEKNFQQSYGYKQMYSFFVIALIILLVEPIRLKTQQFIDHAFFRGTVLSLHMDKERLTNEIVKQDRMKAVSILAAGMAHEIKNPLTSIKTFAEYLPKKYDDPEFREKFSRIVVDEVDRVNNIVKQLLEFSKPSPPDLRPVLVGDLLDQTLGLLNNNMVRHNIEVIKELDIFAMVQADRNQLKQAFLNLFLNAIQSMQDGGKLHVSVRSEHGGKTRISISDSGSGMGPDQIQHAFDPFFTTKEGGTGLGLAIVHSIITKHGGKIEIQSELGKGTTVNVFLKSRD